MDIKRLLHGSRGDNAQKTEGSLIAHILVVIALGLASALIVSTVKCSREAVKRLAESATPTPTVVSSTIFSFTMAPDPVRAGETVTLSWETDARRVYLIADSNHHPDDTYKHNCFGGFPGVSGSYSVQIREQRAFTLYTINEDALPTSCMDADLTLLCYCAEMLWTSHPFGASARIEVICSSESWFFPDPPEACPASDAAELEPQEMVMQAFAGGTVILAGEGQDLYVLYRDHNRLQRIHRWDCGDSRQCDWDEMWNWLLVKNPDRHPPEWGEEEAPKVIDELGPAQAPEIHYTGYHQCVAGEFWNCYISGPNASVYYINTFYSPYDNGWWRLVQQPSPNQ